MSIPAPEADPAKLREAPPLRTTKELYTRPWEQLSDALRRVMAVTGASVEDAQLAICQAIADGRVKVRCLLGRHTTKRMKSSGTVLEGSDLYVPAQILPRDMDWEGSRPTNPWIVRRGAHSLPGLWDLEWIELSRTDVTNVLCLEGRRGSAPPTSIRDAKTRSRPALERTKRVIDELYPQGVPEQAAEPNTVLCRRVGEMLKKLGLPDVSDETILRAAGRRK